MFKELKNKMYNRLFNKISAVIGFSIVSLTLMSPLVLLSQKILTNPNWCPAQNASTCPPQPIWQTAPAQKGPVQRAWVQEASVREDLLDAELAKGKPLQKRSTQEASPNEELQQEDSAYLESMKNENEKDVINSLVLVDESANQVLDLLEQLTKKTILRQQELPKVKINLNSNGKISKKDAILALESLLSMNGIAIVEMGDSFLKAVPALGVQTQSPRMLTETSLDADPSQVIYSKIYKLKYLSTQEGLQAIAAIGTKGVSSQVPLVKSNAILVVDTLTNLQRIERLFSEFDKPLALQEELLFYSMKYVSVADVKAQIDAMKKGNLKKYLESTTVEADKNSNQLIVLTHAQNKHIIDQIVEKLDIDVQPLNKTQVIRLQHADAVEVATLIKAVVKGIPMPKREGGDPRAQLLEKLRESASAKAQSPASTKATDKAQEGQQFSESLTIEPDERSNAIVIYGTPRDLELVRGLVDELDVLLAQVQIEVLIVEVTLTDDQVSGLETFDLRYNTKPATDLGPQGRTRLNGTTPTTDALITVATSLAGSFNPNAFEGLFKVAKENRNVRILSVPMVVTTHNREAQIKVVVDQPIIGEAITSTTNNNNLNQTTKYLNDIGIVLTVTPRIGPNGIIQMEIKQTVKTLLPSITIAQSADTTISAPPVSNREATSYVSVKDQEVIVLAGLQQRITTFIKQKIWLLGCLPIVGDLLFSPSSDTEETKELIMFIRPHVMYNMEDVREVTCEAMDNNVVANDDIDYFMHNGHISRESTMPPWRCGLGTFGPFPGPFLGGPCEPCDPCCEVVEEKPKKQRKHPCHPITGDWDQ